MYKCLGLFCTLSLFLLFSCKKDNSGGNTPSSSSYLSSATSVSPLSRTIDSLTYDGTHRLTSFSQEAFDTTGGYPAHNKLVVAFSYTGTATTPSSYTYNDTISGIVNDVHQLSYDGQGRILKDTSHSGSGFVTYYSYPGGNIAATLLFDGTVANNQIDTMFLSGGNISSVRYYYPNNAGTADELNAIAQFGFSSTANPTYHLAISNSIGPLLSTLQLDGFGGIVDFVSKNALNKVSSIEQGTIVPAINYTLTNDSQGRLVQMGASVSGIQGSIVFRYY